eukprot:1191715-Prorocentrum_minimum.AAC.4
MPAAGTNRVRRGGICQQPEPIASGEGVYASSRSQSRQESGYMPATKGSDDEPQTLEHDSKVYVEPLLIERVHVMVCRKRACGVECTLAVIGTGGPGMADLCFVVQRLKSGTTTVRFVPGRVMLDRIERSTIPFLKMVR